MKRPIGVTAGAVVALLGSIVALLFAASAVASLFIDRPPQTPGAGTPGAGMVAIVGMALVITGIAAVGIWTAVGLFRLRPWARTAVQVLALFVVIACGFMLLMYATVRAPAGISQDTFNAVRIATGIMFAVPLLLAIWILFQFNTSTTKRAFASGASVNPSPRPLSITFIAWAMLVSFASLLVSAVVGGPVFLLGVTLSPWVARVYDVALAGFCFYVGKGLLDLRERARLLTIGLSLFTLLNGAALFLPSSRERILNLQRSSIADPQTAFPLNLDMVLTVGFGAVAVVAAAAIWFLQHHRDTFLGAENSRFLGRLPGKNLPRQ